MYLSYFKEAPQDTYFISVHESILLLLKSMVILYNKSNSFPYLIFISFLLFLTVWKLRNCYNPVSILIYSTNNVTNAMLSTIMTNVFKKSILVLKWHFGSSAVNNIR